MDKKKLEQNFYSFTVITAVATIVVAVVVLFISTNHINEKYSEEYELAYQAYCDELDRYDKQVEAVRAFKKTGKVPCVIRIEAWESGPFDNNVGHDLSYSCSINGKEISSGSLDEYEKKVYKKLKTREANTFSFSVEEWDASYSDYGSNTVNRNFTVDDLIDGKLVEIKTYVYENNGRSSGNTQEFAATFRIKAKESFVTDYDDLDKPIRPVLKTNSLFGTLFDSWKVDIVLLILIVIAVSLIVSKRKEIKAEEERLIREAEEQKRIAEGRASLLDTLSGITLNQYIGAPSNIKFRDGLPYDNNDRKYGSFTVYLSKNGSKYHKKQGCSSARISSHLFNAIERRYEPCSRCCVGNSNIPDWYFKYKELKKKMAELNITDEELYECQSKEIKN